MDHLKMELRHWVLSDAKELTNLCNAVDRHYLSDRLPNPYTEKDAAKWLKMVSENEAVSGIYRAIVYDGKLIGSISVEKKHDDAEIGYMLLNEYSNKGLATEAVKQVCTFAFKVLSLEKITANVFQPNIASIRVLLKNGFKYKGAITNAVIKDGNVYNLLIYRLTKDCNENLARFKKIKLKRNEYEQEK
ncbi:MAG: GNAT family N-acetyltransferase [Prevotella sp.]|jgi:RimJ/RimL family protein N-acetyltransferase|nr:GNAT family N-acetyltransferase [Prevotella sp.]